MKIRRIVVEKKNSNSIESNGNKFTFAWEKDKSWLVVYLKHPETKDLFTHYLGL